MAGALAWLKCLDLQLVVEDLFDGLLTLWQLDDF